MFKLLYVCAFAVLAVCFWDKVKIGKINSSNALLIITMLAVTFIVVFVFIKHPSYLESSATTLITLPLLLCIDSLRITKKESKLYYMLLVPIAIILIVAVFIKSNYQYDTLVLYTGNSNQSGLLYMCVFIGIFVYQFLNKANILILLLEVGLLYGCWLTQSRTAFFACIFTVALTFLIYYLPRIKKFVLIGAFVAMIITPLAMGPFSLMFDGDITIMGSSIFTGREFIWPEVLKNLFSSILSPFVFRIDQMAYQSSYGIDLGAHHVMLDIAWKYTVPMAVIFLAAVWLTGKRLTKHFENRKSSVVVACMVAVLLHMTMEASIIGGALDYTLYAMLNIFCAVSMLDGKEASDEKAVD